MPTQDSRGIIRLEVQVEGMAKEVHRLNNLIMGANSPTDARFSQLEKSVNTRMEAFEENQKAISAHIEKLADKMDQRSRFPFAQTFSFVGLLFLLGGGVGGLILNGFRSDVTRIERDVTTLQTQTVPRVEHQSRWDSQNDAMNKIQGRLEWLENRIRK